MGKIYETYWYCSQCLDGPWSYALMDACIGCDHIRDTNDICEQTFREISDSPSRQSRNLAYTAMIPETSPSFPLATKQSHVKASPLVDPLSATANLKTFREQTQTSPFSVALSEFKGSPSPLKSHARHQSAEGFQANVQAPTKDISKRRAEYLSYLILGGVRIDIDFEAKTIHCTGYESGSTSKKNSSSSSTENERLQSAPDSGSGSRSKRRYEQGQDDGEEQHDKRRGKKQQTRQISRQKDVNEKLLACPFYKRHRRKYASYLSCHRTGFTNIWRLKEHITKKHLIYQCTRCWVEFQTTDDLNEHQHETTACPMRLQRHVFNKIDQRTREELPKLARGESHQACWRRIYSMLFIQVPGEETPSPYHHDEDEVDNNLDDDDIDRDNKRLDNCVRSELSHRIYAHLNCMIEQSLQEGGDAAYHSYIETIRHAKFQNLLRSSVFRALDDLRPESSTPLHPGSIQPELSIDNSDDPKGKKPGYLNGKVLSELPRGHECSDAREPSGALSPMVPSARNPPDAHLSHDGEIASYLDGWAFTSDFSTFDATAALEHPDLAPSTALDPFDEVLGANLDLSLGGLENVFVMYNEIPQLPDILQEHDINTTSPLETHENPPPLASNMSSLALNRHIQGDTPISMIPEEEGGIEPDLWALPQPDESRRSVMADQYWNLKTTGFDPYPQGFHEALFGPDYQSNAKPSSDADVD